MLWLKLLAVEALVAAVFAPAAALHHDGSSTLTSVSVAVAAIAVIIAGAFTIRAHVASTWRTEAEAQKDRADRLEQAAARERAEQQHVRHELKEALAVEKAKLLVSEAKTDLSVHEAQAVQRHEATLSVLTAIHQNLVALADSIRGK